MEYDENQLKAWSRVINAVMNKLFIKLLIVYKIDK
jgi:hypothetical protein